LRKEKNMKRLLVSGVAVLLLAAAARAQNVSMSWSLTSGTDRDPATPVFDALRGDVFTTTLSIQTEYGLIGWNARFLDPAGFPVGWRYLDPGWDPWVGPPLPGGSGTLPLPGLYGWSPTGWVHTMDIFQMVLTVPAAQPFGTVYVTATSATAADVDYSDWSIGVAPLPINIVPEPAGVLLLLTGLPLLRRRR
jgi:hypothetical protein